MYRFGPRGHFTHRVASVEEVKATVGELELDSPDGRLLIGTTVAGSAVAMLTATVVNVALPTLAGDLGASSGQLQWVANGYLLALASLILIGGSLGDRFGRVRVYRAGIASFAVASLLCAIAPTIELLIAARFLQGIGAALFTPGSLAIIEATLRSSDRGRGVGQWSGLGGVAGAIGPLLGGVLVDVSWRLVFIVNIPIAIVVIVISVKIPESFDPESAKHPLDIPGAVLTAVTLGGASYALIEGPSAGFGTALVGLAIVATVVGAIALVWAENRREHPMLAFDLFSIRSFLAANVVTVFVYAGLGLVFFLLTVQLQVSLGWSPLIAGAALLPITLMLLTGSAKGGELAQRFGPRWPLTFGPLLIAAAMLLYSRVGPGDNYVTDVLPGTLLFGLGLVLSVAPVTASALGAAPDERAGAASGINNAVSRTGQLLAIAAVPPLVGLTGDALNDPELLTAGFDNAMFVGAALLCLGAVFAAVLYRPEQSDPRPPHNETRARTSNTASPLVGGRSPYSGPDRSLGQS